ncbi:glucan endo-1,3-beta-glucosidase 4-like [Hibiscus syriacus]|uniref:Glucan endo-1,3-beta-glucosidase 4-like n=1 Tax=Hibiscus syriacus TaxID=106335 RepID=A0A6A3AM59_HIBSY|nr:glucan endo-1,3-beta-glucosidase 4-like [Hibiscus syriacus]
MLLGFASSHVNQDKAECADKLAGLAPCIQYVGGEAKTPTVDCCGGIEQVLDKNMKCLCELLKDKDDPSLGLKINTTIEATLPSTCHAPGLGSSSSGASSAAEKSEGGRGKRWMGFKMALGVSLWIFVSCV